MKKVPFLATPAGHRDIIQKGRVISTAVPAFLPSLLLKTSILTGAHPPQFFAIFECLQASSFMRPELHAELHWPQCRISAICKMQCTGGQYLAHIFISKHPLSTIISHI